MLIDSTCLENFFRGWNSIGIATQPQPAGGDSNGVFYGTVSIKGRNQSRDSSANAYYRPIAKKRRNLHLLVGSAVSKINFDERKRAVSVDVSGTEIPIFPL